MAEYIEKQALIKALEADFNRSWSGNPTGVEEYVDGARDEYDDVLKIICQQKATDVQRGKWVGIGELFSEDWKCSVCGNSHGKANSSNFCSFCGADMREHQ